MAWKRDSGMWGSLQRIQRYLQVGSLMATQVQSLSSLTIQQSAAISKVVTNSTFSLALVFSVSAGSGKALPTDSFLTPLRQQTLSTLMVLSALREQVAVVFWQLRSKKNGMTACSYHVPQYLAMSTQGTVLGGSLVRFEMESSEVVASCHPSNPMRMGMRISAVLFIKSFLSSSGILEDVQWGNKK